MVQYVSDPIHSEESLEVLHYCLSFAIRNSFLILGAYLVLPKQSYESPIWL
jgi:hypothetical protein